LFMFYIPAEELSAMDVIVIPVAHVSEESSRVVREAIEREKPDVVAVELDMGRFQAMMSQAKPRMRDFLLNPFLGLIYIFQQAFGKGLGVVPGSEMLAAVQTAQKHGVPVAFVDRPLAITANRLAHIPLSEKLNIAMQMLLTPLAFIPNPFSKRKPFNPDMLTDPALIEEVMKEFRKHLPHTYKVLVDERDDYMFGLVSRLDAQRVVLVVGAGHVAGISRRAALFGEPAEKGLAS